MGAWTQSILGGLGNVGESYGKAVDYNTQLALKTIHDNLLNQEIQSRLKEQDFRLKQMQTPQFKTFTTPGQGTAGLTVDPMTGRPMGKAETIIPGEIIPKTIDQAWIEATTRENKGQPPTSAQIQEHIESKRNPVDQLLDEGNRLQAIGDVEGAQTYYKMASTVAGARKGPASTGSVMGVIIRAQQGDQEARKAFDTYMKAQEHLAQVRGQAFGAGRAMYNISAYVDPDTGVLVPMSALDAINAIHNGKSFIPSGRLPANMAVSVEQLTSEAGPALKETRRYLSAYDDASDRAIFARVLANNPAATPGRESQWLGTVLDQALISGLSPQGQSLVIRLNRLNESVGRLRAVLGLPATERMVAMTLAMVPGPTTPDSKYAAEVLDNLQATIDNAVAIPALGGIAKTNGKKKEVIDLTK